MTQILDVAQFQDELIDAFKWGEMERASALISKLAAQPGQARRVLDEMLTSPDANARRAAVFGLGELGGVISLKRLEQQMIIEEERDDYDGASVLEVITQTLGRIKETNARSSLARRLERLVTRKASPADLDDVSYALWRKHHPELIPVVRSALERLPPENSERLRALLRLLEVPPAALSTWALDAATPLRDKTKILTLLDEKIPDELLPVLPALISAASALDDGALRKDGEAAYYCDRLFTTLLLHLDQILPTFTPKIRSELRSLARRCVPSVDLNCSSHGARMLQYVGVPDDAELIEAHRPTEPIIAREYDDIARAVRNLPTA